MASRTARLSVGAAGCVILWIVAFWWVDSDPTIRFDESGRDRRELAEPPVTVSQQPPLVQTISQPIEKMETNKTPSASNPAQSSNATQSRTPPSNPESNQPSQGTREYTIQPGDLLSRIAAREYGSIRYTTFLYEHNRERLGLTSPDAIREGQVLELPPLSEAESSGGGDE